MGLRAIVLPVLGLLTWRQAGMYTDMETLWRTRWPETRTAGWPTTIWAVALGDKGRFDEAIENYRKAIQIDPNTSKR